jgi:hypothetical protein
VTNKKEKGDDRDRAAAAKRKQRPRVMKTTTDEKPHKGMEPSLEEYWSSLDHFSKTNLGRIDV